MGRIRSPGIVLGLTSRWGHGSGGKRSGVSEANDAGGVDPRLICGICSGEGGLGVNVAGADIAGADRAGEDFNDDGAGVDWANAATLSNRPAPASVPPTHRSDEPVHAANPEPLREGRRRNESSDFTQTLGRVNLHAAHRSQRRSADGTNDSNRRGN